jgi:hypothetical protein
MSEKNFFELAERESFLIVLDSSQQKGAFSFKGKCLLSLLFGQIQVNGYLMKCTSETFKFQNQQFELYSPETNAFLEIKNLNLSQPKYVFFIQF